MSIDTAALKDVLYSAVLSDLLDEFGLREQAMRPFIRPLDEQLPLFGRARTGIYMNVFEIPEGDNPYEVEIALVDDLKPGDVAVLACDGPTDRIAPWGELLSTAARCRGAVGCVTDGLVRDIRAIRKMNFPVFHGGIGPLDSKGRAKMMAMDVPVKCGGVLVHSGDLIFGDADGVVVIPQAMAEKVIAAATAKISTENSTRAELEQGLLLMDVYKKYGVL
jgi:4-hydroxy-4-methyl-2-oxoglutarate aldolase